MNLNKFFIIFSLGFLVFSSCKNGEKETIDPVETTDATMNERDAGNELVDAVENNPELSTFATALNAWNVEDSLNTMEEEVIIFAPNNMAFSLVRQNTEAGSMVAIEDEEMIPYHIIKTGDDLTALKEEIRALNDTLNVRTVQGEEIKLSLDGNSLVITGATGDSAKITDSLQAGTGMVYIIDKVLLPRDTSTEVIISNEG